MSQQSGALHQNYQKQYSNVHVHLIRYVWDEIDGQHMNNSNICLDWITNHKTYTMMNGTGYAFIIQMSGNIYPHPAVPMHCWWFSEIVVMLPMWMSVYVLGDYTKWWFVKPGFELVCVCFLRVSYDFFLNYHSGVCLQNSIFAHHLWSSFIEWLVYLEFYVSSTIQISAIQELAIYSILVVLATFLLLFFII